jgi:hypothetical protein
MRQGHPEDMIIIVERSDIKMEDADCKEKGSVHELSEIASLPGIKS